MNKALVHFVASLFDYDLSKMLDKEEMQDMASLCEEMRLELYE